MSEPVHLFNIQIITNGDMSSNIISLSTNLDEAASYSIQAVFTGTPVGVLMLEGTNDVPTTDTNLTNWTIITDSESDVLEAGSYLINVEFPVYSYVRLVYTRTSGSGTLNARINAKRR